MDNQLFVEHANRNFELRVLGAHALAELVVLVARVLAERQLAVNLLRVRQHLVAAESSGGVRVAERRTSDALNYMLIFPAISSLMISTISFVMLVGRDDINVLDRKRAEVTSGWNSMLEEPSH